MVGAYWKASSELEWELVSGILGGGIENLINVELGKYYQKTLLRTIGNLIRTFSWELYQEETLSAFREPYRQVHRQPVNNLSSKALYRNFVGNLKPTEPYIGILSETLSGNFEAPIGTLLETWNRRPEIGNWLGTLLETGRNPAESCLDMPRNIYSWELCLGTLFGNSAWEPCLGTLFGNPVWGPCWKPCWEPC